MPVIKCAVYVRKSTEHGLEQAFNSLDNQEQSCKAYISSQAFNNWEYTKTYSDGGISGGTMERHGLQEMLSDIAKGHNKHCYRVQGRPTVTLYLGLS